MSISRKLSILLGSCVFVLSNCVIASSGIAGSDESDAAGGSDFGIDRRAPNVVDDSGSVGGNSIIPSGSSAGSVATVVVDTQAEDSVSEDACGQDESKSQADSTIENVDDDGEHAALMQEVQEEAKSAAKDDNPQDPKTQCPETLSVIEKPEDAEIERLPGPVEEETHQAGFASGAEDANNNGQLGALSDQGGVCSDQSLLSELDGDAHEASYDTETGESVGAQDHADGNEDVIKGGVANGLSDPVDPEAISLVSKRKFLTFGESATIFEFGKKIGKSIQLIINENGNISRYDIEEDVGREKSETIDDIQQRIDKSISDDICDIFAKYDIRFVKTNAVSSITICDVNGASIGMLPMVAMRGLVTMMADCGISQVNQNELAQKIEKIESSQDEQANNESIKAILHMLQELNILAVSIDDHNARLVITYNGGSQEQIPVQQILPSESSRLIKEANLGRSLQGEDVYERSSSSNVQISDCKDIVPVNSGSSTSGNESSLAVGNVSDWRLNQSVFDNANAQIKSRLAAPEDKKLDQHSGNWIRKYDENKPGYSTSGHNKYLLGPVRPEEGNAVQEQKLYNLEYIDSDSVGAKDLECLDGIDVCYKRKNETGALYFAGYDRVLADQTTSDDPKTADSANGYALFSKVVEKLQDIVGGEDVFNQHRFLFGNNTTIIAVRQAVESIKEKMQLVANVRGLLGVSDNLDNTDFSSKLAAACAEQVITTLLKHEDTRNDNTKDTRASWLERQRKMINTLVSSATKAGDIKERQRALEQLIHQCELCCTHASMHIIRELGDDCYKQLLSVVVKTEYKDRLDEQSSVRTKYYKINVMDDFINVVEKRLSIVRNKFIMEELVPMVRRCLSYYKQYENAESYKQSDYSVYTNRGNIAQVALAIINAIRQKGDNKGDKIEAINFVKQLDTSICGNLLLQDDNNSTMFADYEDDICKQIVEIVSLLQVDDIRSAIEALINGQSNLVVTDMYKSIAQWAIAVASKLLYVVMSEADEMVIILDRAIKGRKLVDALCTEADNGKELCVGIDFNEKVLSRIQKICQAANKMMSGELLTDNTRGVKYTDIIDDACIALYKSYIYGNAYLLHDNNQLLVCKSISEVMWNDISAAEINVINAIQGHDVSTQDAAAYDGALYQKARDRITCIQDVRRYIGEFASLSKFELARVWRNEYKNNFYTLQKDGAARSVVQRTIDSIAYEYMIRNLVFGCIHRQNSINEHKKIKELEYNTCIKCCKLNVLSHAMDGNPANMSSVIKIMQQAFIESAKQNLVYGQQEADYLQNTGKITPDISLNFSNKARTHCKLVDSGSIDIGEIQKIDERLVQIGQEYDVGMHKSLVVMTLSGEKKEQEIQKANDDIKKCETKLRELKKKLRHNTDQKNDMQKRIDSLLKSGEAIQASIGDVEGQISETRRVLHFLEGVCTREMESGAGEILHDDAIRKLDSMALKVNSALSNATDLIKKYNDLTRQIAVLGDQLRLEIEHVGKMRASLINNINASMSDFDAGCILTLRAVEDQVMDSIGSTDAKYLQQCIQRYSIDTNRKALACIKLVDTDAAEGNIRSIIASGIIVSLSDRSGEACKFADDINAIAYSHLFVLVTERKKLVVELKELKQDIEEQEQDLNATYEAYCREVSALRAKVNNARSSILVASEQDDLGNSSLSASGSVIYCDTDAAAIKESDTLGCSSVEVSTPGCSTISFNN